MEADREQRRKPAGLFGFLHWLSVRFVIAAVILALGYFGYRYVFTDQLDEQIRLLVQRKFREHYHGLVVTVESARRIEGEGIEIRGLSISEVDHPREPMLYVERIVSNCNVALPDMLTQEPVVSRLVLRRAHVRAVRRTNGFWNVRHLFPPPKFSEHTPPIVFEGCTAEIIDEAHPERDPPQWRDICATLTPDPQAGEELGLAAEDAKCAIRLAGSMTGDHFREVRVEGSADVRSGLWSIVGEVDQLQFTPEMREKLPQDLAAEFAPIAAVSGNTHLRFATDNLAGPDSPLRFSVEGEIADGRIDDARLPLPLTELSARLFADNAGFKIEDFKARLGAAAIDLFLQLDGYEGASPMTLRVNAENLALDERLAAVLPADARRLWDQLSPSGLATGRLKLDFDGESWQPELDAQLEQMTFAYEKAPYRMSDGQATVKLLNGLLTVKGTASAGNSTVQFGAEVYDPGPNWHGHMEAHSQEPLPIDDRLLGALTPSARDLVQSLAARGRVQLTGHWDRRQGSQRPPHVHLDVELQDCSVTYRLFPYPIDHITGTLHSADGVWSFKNLKGSQGTTQIESSGSFGPDAQGPLLTMEFRCSDVALDEHLRKALRSDQQQLWNDLRIRGELDRLDASMSYRPAEKKFTLEVDAQKLQRRDDRAQQAVRIEPTWFPYAMDITSGTASYRDGVVKLTRLRGAHSKTKLEADGQCRWTPEGEWSFVLDRLIADRLQLDHELLAALPRDAGAALAKAKYSGMLGMTGNLQFSGQQGRSSADAAWDLAFDIEDGRLAGDTPAEHIQGGLRVVGGMEAGRWFSRGDVNLDSLFVRDVQVTHVRGPFLVDSKQLVIGSWADRDQKNQIAPRRLTAQVFDGLLTTDGSLSLEDDGKFSLQASLEEASLAKIARETGSSAHDISGKTFGVLQMTGTTRGKHTWQGGGNVRLRDAYLYKVPVMLALVKILSVRSADDSTFTASDVDYRLQGDDVILDRIDLTGDAISLRGTGRLFEQKQVDLQFYTQVGRREIKILRPLIAEATPSFLMVEVSGTIDHPAVEKTALPALNETLKDLFPDLARENEGASEAKNTRGGLFRR